METQIAHNVEEIPRSDDVRMKTALPFKKMSLEPALIKGLQQAGYIYPTHIQAAAIPIGITGMDLLVQSKAGTGKTLIFSSIILQAYRYKVRAPQSLIVVPTREIALQIEDVLNQVGRYCQGFLAVSVIGGLDVAEDRKRLANARCVVGTPGRLLHLILASALNVMQIRLLVLDEADKLFTKSFQNDLHKIKATLMARRQLIACSATFPNDLDKELAKMMRNPMLVSTEDRSTVLLGIKQFVFVLPKPTATSMQEMQAKLDGVRYIFESLTFKQSVLFTNSQSRADSYCNYLTRDGWPCDLLTAAICQKDRIDVFRKLRAFKTRVLFATDLMSRGIDSEHINLVVNMEMPSDVVTYLHRIGRAGRFGSQGIAISFLSSPKDERNFKLFMEQVGGNMPVYIFPTKTELDPKKEIEFWNFEDNSQFKMFGTQTKTTKKLAPLASLEQLTVSETQRTNCGTADVESSINTKTFHLNSKESAYNLCELPVVESGSLAVQKLEKGINVSNETIATLTTTDNLPISSNTIDDASSIAADSLRSSRLDVSGLEPVKVAPKKPQNPFEKCLQQSNGSKPTKLNNSNSQPVNIFDDYEAYMLKSDNDDSDTETVEHKLNTEIMAKMETLLIDSKSKSKKLQEACIDPFEDYENFQVPDDTSISATLPTNAEQQGTFILSVGTPSNMPESIEEYQETSEEASNQESTTDASDQERVKHFPSPAHQEPSLQHKLLQKKFKQMKLTINNVAQLEIPPCCAMMFQADTDDSTMPNSSASQSTRTGTLANNVAISRLSMNGNIDYSDCNDDDDEEEEEEDEGEDSSSEEDYFADLADDDDGYDENNIEAELEEEDDLAATANEARYHEAYPDTNDEQDIDAEEDEDGDDESDTSTDDNVYSDSDNNGETSDESCNDQETMDDMLRLYHKEMMRAYHNYNAKMAEYIRYYQLMQKANQKYKKPYKTTKKRNDKTTKNSKTNSKENK